MGRYRIAHVLARGGMGEVYLARLEGAAGFVRPAVIKRILPIYSSDESLVRMFVREARLLSDLRHPNIVSVLDFLSEGGEHLMALEYVHGYSVMSWARYLKKEGRDFPTWLAVWIIIEVLDALHYAHTRSDDVTGVGLGIIHRDVSPSNVLIDTEGHVRLLDFGVAREMGHHTVPKDGEINLRGKFPYLPPELFDGDAAGPKSDLYACGVLLHALLAGGNEFRRKDPHQTIRRVFTHVLTPLTGVREEVTPALDAVIAKAVIKEPSERYDSAGELADALRALLPLREREIRDQLREAARGDFFGGMPAAIGLEPLESLENAWKREPEPESEIGEKPTLDPPPLVSSNAVTEAAVVKVASPARIRWGLVVGVGLALLLSAVGLVVALTGPSAPERIVIVERRLGDDPEDDPEPGGSALPAADAGNAAAGPGGDGGDAASGTEPAVRRPRDRAARLTAAFHRRRARLRACFVSHTQSLDGTPQISVRFQVRGDGSVESAQLSPAALAGTSLGRCLRGVAMSTEFGRQPGPAAFTIPIAVRGD